MSDYSLLSDEELVRLCKGDDSEALSVLTSRYMKVAGSIAYGFSNDYIETDDLVQEGMLGFWSAVYSFNDSLPASFRTYAGICIRHRIITTIKSFQVKKHVPESLLVPIDDSSDFADSTLTPEEILVSNREVERIASIISMSLSPQEQKVFRLYLVGHSYSEISESSGLSLKSVDSTIQRARKKLRQELK